MLSAIQNQLARLYRLDPAIDVGEFVVPRSQVETLALDRPEQVLVNEEDGTVELALVMDDHLLEKEGPWGINEMCLGIEGVSHLLYLALAVERGVSVSAFELELQAEIDKFALLFFVMTRRQNAGALIKRLYVKNRLHESIDCADERRRYNETNRLAHNYSRFLEKRFVLADRIQGLLDELRRVYRMGGDRKIEYVSECRL